VAVRAVNVARERIRGGLHPSKPILPLEAGESGVAVGSGPEDVRARALARVPDPSDLEFLARRYNEQRHFGNVVSRDDAKDLFYPNGGRPDERTALNDAVSDASGVVADRVFADRLARPKLRRMETADPPQNRGESRI
jgi:hypothetical protein